MSNLYIWCYWTRTQQAWLNVESAEAFTNDSRTSTSGRSEEHRGIDEGPESVFLNNLALPIRCDWLDVWAQKLNLLHCAESAVSGHRTRSLAAQLGEGYITHGWTLNDPMWGMQISLDSIDIGADFAEVIILAWFCWDWIEEAGPRKHKSALFIYFVRFTSAQNSCPEKLEKIKNIYMVHKWYSDFPAVHKFLPTSVAM